MRCAWVGLASLIALMGASPALRADMILEQYKVTATVKVDAMDIHEYHLMFAEKPDHIHVIMDAFPYRDAVKARGKDFSWSAFAASLAKDVVFPRYPKVSKAVVDIVEYPERDDYGAPRWESVVRLGTYDAVRHGDKVSVKPRPKKGQ